MTEQQQPFRGPQTPSTGATDEEEIRAARIANRFDIRRIIGGLFLLYGVILAIVGIVGSDEVKNKAAGINVNLWTGPGHARLRWAHDLLGARAAGGAGARGHARPGIGAHPALAGDVGRESRGSFAPRGSSARRLGCRAALTAASREGGWRWSRPWLLRSRWRCPAAGPRSPVRFARVRNTFRRARGRTSVFPRLEGVGPTFDTRAPRGVAKDARLHPQGAHA